MSLAEASRLYQAALEADRTVRARLEGILSAEDELGESQRELDQAWEHVRREWLVSDPA